MNGRNPLWTFSGVRQAAWLFFAFLYIPILVLVVLSFNSGQSATLWESFSLKWYAVVANDPEILRAAKNSLLVATLATLASTVLATLAALGMRGRAFRGQTLMNGVLGLPLLVKGFDLPENPAGHARTSAATASTSVARRPPPRGLVILSGFATALLIQGVLAATLSALIARSFGTEVSLLGLALSAAGLSGIIQALRWSWEPWLAGRFGAWSDGPRGR
ncbi:hypothetical protein WAI64_19225, partial [Acinetobacter baumannii]